MDNITAEILCHMNTRFYAEHAESFSATRSSCWAGWKKLLDVLQEQGAAWDGPCIVTDVACGNMRFERFLQDALPNTEFEFHCVDNCLALAEAGAKQSAEDAFGEEDEPEIRSTESAPLRFHQLDVVSRVLQREAVLHGIPQADLSVSFGFLHHIPTQAARIHFVRELLGRTRCGGFAVVSLWRFADEPDRREKAQLSTQSGCEEWGIEHTALDAGDYLLGWQNAAHAYRYCHSFCDEEVEEIADAVSESASACISFRADGKSGNLNEYLLFRIR